MGPSPSGRSGHAMASIGSKVYVVGGESFAPLRGEDPNVIHVLDTSESFFLFFSFFSPSLLRLNRTHQVPRRQQTTCKRRCSTCQSEYASEAFGDESDTPTAGVATDSAATATNSTDAVNTTSSRRSDGTDSRASIGFCNRQWKSDVTW